MTSTLRVIIFSVSALMTLTVAVVRAMPAEERRRGRDGLPEVAVPLPTANQPPTTFDNTLRTTFPGQFFGSRDVRLINRQEQAARRRRELDKDLCCITDVWFGNAPDQLADVDNRTWSVVQGANTSQAYSRGECHNSYPPTPICPTGGRCVQHFRLHTLWVREESQAKLKYFRIPSHCAYEQEDS